MLDGSGVSREAPAPFCERPEAKSLRPTRHTLHWTLDVTFQEDLSRLRKGHGAQNMALVRKFAFNRLRAATKLSDPPNLPIKPCRRPTKPPRPKSLKLRRKIASWDVNRLAEILMIQPG